MKTLFDLRPNFRVAQIGSEDARNLTDHLVALRDLVLPNENLYPGIEKWWTEKVVPGLRIEERVGWVGYEGETAVASAILKKGACSKFCHVRIQEDFQDLRLGEVFFAVMTLNVRHLADEIHFTLPESLWTNKSFFFESFGFAHAVRSEIQYRTGETELKCSAPFKEVWARVLEKLPELSRQFSVGGFGSSLLMSVKPAFAEKIFSGEKKVEIRKKPVASKWAGRRMAVYASAPACSLQGEARIKAVEIRSPGEIWKTHESDIGCTKEEFDRYTESSKQVTGIILDQVRAFRYPIPLIQLAQLLRLDLKPPQSYLSLENNETWAQGVSVATLLHGNFTLPPQTLFL